MNNSQSLTYEMMKINKIKKGCGKPIPIGIPPRIWDCTKPCGSGGYLCKECQDVLLKDKDVSREVIEKWVN